MTERSLVDQIRNRSPSDRAGSGGNRSSDDSLRGVGPFGAVPAGIAEPATLGVLAVTLAYLSVFVSITNVVGGTPRLIAAVLVAAVGGVVLARTIGERTAIRLTVVLFAVALVGYYLAIPESQRALLSIRTVGSDVLSLLTGLSVLRLALADVWALAVAPVPTFLVAYLVGRGRHVGAATAAGATLGFFVLTGDTGGTTTLVGVLGVAAAAGLSTLSVPGGLRSNGDALAAVLALMLLASATVTVIPAGAAQPWGVGGGTPGIESTLDDGDELEIVGATRLSPEVRFTVESPVERNWHTASYDTYTGDGWVRSGDTSSFEGPLSGPPGETATVEGTFTAETEIEAFPSPWQAVDVSGAATGSAQVDEHGTIRATAPVLPDERVVFESRVVDADPVELRNASTEYDSAIEDRYTQLPDSTPDRVGERTEAIIEAADADTPYDQALAIERYLIEEYDYSLTVERPDGDIADGFLFEMDAGYCTYFATTMVAMLRSQGVPAQFATGYSSGERVGDDEYVVRGQDAHAWVKVYVPEHGWIEFDPTPSAERDQVRDARLAEARSGGDEGVDTERSDPETTDMDPLDPRLSNGGDGSVPDDETTESDGDTPENDEEPAGNDDESVGDDDGLDPAERAVEEEQLVRGETIDGDGGGDGLPLPSRESIGFWLFVVAVAGVGARHAGLTERAYHGMRIRLPGRSGTPRADAERAFADLERLLSREYRDRRPGETPRAYLDALRERGVDDRVHAVGETYERAVYAGDVTREEADEAERTVRRLAVASTPVIGGLFDRE